MERDDNVSICDIFRPRRWRALGTSIVFNFLFMSVAAYVLLGLIFGGIIHRIESSHNNYRFIDTLFSSVSAVTITGLITLDTSTLRLGSQLCIMLLLVFGSTQLMSVVPVFMRSILLQRWLKQHKKTVTDQNLIEMLSLELRVLNKLRFLIIGYFVVHVVLAGILYSVYNVGHDRISQEIRDRDVNPWFAGYFLGMAVFTNAGFSVFTDSIVIYQRSTWPLFLSCYLILAGNTGYPVFFRLWLLLRKRLNRFFDTSDNQVYAYMLEHPRRCYTHLFTNRITVWLSIILFGVTILQWVVMMGFLWHQPPLNPNKPPINANYTLSTGEKILNAFTQSVSTRTAGVNSIDLYTMLPAVQLLILAMMYVSGIPVVLSMRSASEEAWDVEEKRKASLGTTQPPTSSVIRTQALNMVQIDLVFIVASWFLISAIEGEQTTTVSGRVRPITSSQLLFEIVSAYGTVGLSLVATPTSLSSKLHTVSKLIIMIVMLAGRHRGLGLLLPTHLARSFRVHTSNAHLHRSKSRLLIPLTPPPPRRDIESVDL